MWNEKEITAKAWLVREVVTLVLATDQLSVDKIFLIGSYASGKQDEWSDLDFLVQLNGGKKLGWKYPSWQQIKEIHMKMDNKRIHIIFGTKESAEALYQKHKTEKKTYAYRELNLGGITNANPHSACA